MLKAYRGVSEVISTIMLNAVATGVIAFLIRPQSFGVLAGNNLTTAPIPPGADHNAQDVTFSQEMILHHDQAIDMADMALTRAADRSGIGPVRMHDLRHTAATLMIEAGVPLRVVADILGHAGIAVTADLYGHPGEASHRAAVAALARVLGGG